MKNIIIRFLLDACSCRSNSPISESTGKAPLVNVPLEILHHSRKSFLILAGNSSWLQTRIKILISTSPTLDDSSWRTLDLPHDFQFEHPWTESGGGARGFKPMCEGWYRKSFPTDPSWKGKRVVLNFGGIIYLAMSI